MKKTTLFLACAVPFLLTACYSTNEPEEVRLQARRDYQALHGCQSQAVYQHKYFKECAAKTAIEQAKNHKTVQLMEDNEGRSIVVPRAPGDDQMMDPNMVYPVVDVTMTEIVVEEGSATQEDMAIDAIQETQAVVVEQTTETTTTETTVTESQASEQTVETQTNETTTVTDAPAETQAVTNVTVETQVTETPKTEEPVETAVSNDVPSLEEQVNALLENGNSLQEQKEVLPTEEK